MSEEVEIELDDDLLEKTRQLAEETGRTVEQVIRDAIMAGTEREEDDSSEEAEAASQAAASVPQGPAGTADHGSSG